MAEYTVSNKDYETIKADVARNMRDSAISLYQDSLSILGEGLAASLLSQRSRNSGDVTTTPESLTKDAYADILADLFNVPPKKAADIFKESMRTNSRSGMGSVALVYKEAVTGK
jgi:hypothetical protein